MVDGTFTGVIHLALKALAFKKGIRPPHWRPFDVDDADRDVSVTGTIEDNVLSFPITDDVLLRLVLVGSMLRGQAPIWEIGSLIVVRKVTS